MRENTKSSNSGPIVAVLPNTAMSTGTASALLLSGLVLLGSATLLAVTVASRPRRR